MGNVPTWWQSLWETAETNSPHYIPVLVPLCASTHCATTQPGIVVPLCSKPLFLILPSWLLFASHLVFLDSSTPIIKLPKYTRGTRFRPLHGEPWWQTVPWKSRIRQISSIVLSLRTHKPASRWCPPKHCYKKPAEMPTPPLVPQTETSLSPPKAACFMVLM